MIDEVDIVYDLAPKHVHPEPIIAALKNDTHVMCEKPLAPTLSEAKRMEEAASDSNAVAAIAFNYRFLPAIQYAKQLISDGALGEIRQVRG